VADSEAALQELLRTNPDRGWHAFVDRYTPLMLGLIRRAGLTDRDEMMDVYLLVCERLSANQCARLKAQDATRGTLGGYLAVACRHAVVDWVRSRRGRRRLFKSVETLPKAEQRVFELFYWERRTPSEIAELLRVERGAPTDLSDVLAMLARVDAQLTERQRTELLAMCGRTMAPASIERGAAHDLAADALSDPARRVHVAEMNARLDAALRLLPSEDAAIVRLKFVEGLSDGDIARALVLDASPSTRIAGILARLQATLAATGVRAADVAALDRGLA